MGTDNGPKAGGLLSRHGRLLTLALGLVLGVVALSAMYLETPMDFTAFVNADFLGIADDDAQAETTGNAVTGLGRRGGNQVPPSAKAGEPSPSTRSDVEATSSSTAAATTTQATGPCDGVPWDAAKGFTLDPPESEEEPWVERWYGGAVQRGVEWPYRGAWSLDLSETRYNQLNPVLVSTFGRWVWSDTPRRLQLSPKRPKSGVICVEGGREGFDTGVVIGGGLRGAFKQAAERHFPASGKMPHAELFTKPQYNLWIDQLYSPSQEAVLAYARSVLDHGLPPGVIMIDTNWAERYGSFSFDRARFPSPKDMVDELHALGFLVILWVTPFVSPDSVEFRRLRALSYLVKNSWGGVGIPEWWDGHSALVDFTNPDAATWYMSELTKLRDEVGVDGFKFDGGDPEYYRQLGGAAAENSLVHLEAFNRMGLQAGNISEFRAAWKMAGTHLAMRLSDKAHTWGDDGLSALVPNGIAQGLSGYAFTCPDMIGGGQYSDFVEVGTLKPKPGFAVDQELFVRFAQASALFPMMQFSLAPWRVLDEGHLASVREAALLHVNHADVILALAEESARTGVPIVRHMEYEYPNRGYESVRDQFLLGSNILVAPITVKGHSHRTVLIPPGRWEGMDGASGEGIVKGPETRHIDCEGDDSAGALCRLIWFQRRP